MPIISNSFQISSLCLGTKMVLKYSFNENQENQIRIFQIDSGWDKGVSEIVFIQSVHLFAFIYLQIYKLSSIEVTFFPIHLSKINFFPQLIIKPSSGFQQESKFVDMTRLEEQLFHVWGPVGAQNSRAAVFSCQYIRF